MSNQSKYSAESGSSSTSTTRTSSPTDLPDDARAHDVKPETAYRARINNIPDEGYGFFVDLNNGRNNVSGLVHVSNLPASTTLDDYDPGDKVIVELDERKDNGDLSFIALQTPSNGTDNRTAHSEPSKQASRPPSQQSNDGHDVLDRVNNPTQDALQTIRALKDDGYEDTGYTTRIDEGGDRVEVSLVLTNPDD